MSNVISYDFVAGDTASKLRRTCRDKGTGNVIDLTGSGIVLQWRDRRTETLVSKTMTVVGSASAGVVEYLFGADELVQGVMLFEIKITDASGHVARSLDLIQKQVRAPLAA